jgi:hypothetical protein
MKIVEIEACAQCPWLVWDARPVCGHPGELDHKIPDTMDVPDFCPLDDLVGLEDE